MDIDPPCYFGTDMVLPASGFRASLATYFYNRAFGAQEIQRHYTLAKLPGTVRAVPHLASIMELPGGERFLVSDIVEDPTLDENMVVRVVGKPSPSSPLPPSVLVAAPPYPQPKPAAEVPTVSPFNTIIFQTPQVQKVTDRALGRGAESKTPVSQGNAFGGPGQHSVVKDPLGFHWHITTPRAG